MRYMIGSVSLLGLIMCQSAFALCGKQTTLMDLIRTDQEGESAFAEMSLERLYTVTTRAREVVVPCLGEKITPRDAAAFHRLMALEAFTQSQRDRVVAEFHAARKLDPGYEIPLEVVPREHQLRKLYDKALMAEDGTFEIVYPPEGGYVTVGGVRNAPRQTKTPVLIQVFRASGEILETRYLQPGQTLPQWGVNPLGITARDLGLGRSAFSEPKTWYVSAGVSAAIAATLYTFALYNKSKFTDTSGHDTVNSDKTLSSYQDRANGFGVSALVTGSLSVVFVGVGIGLHVFENTPTPQGESHERIAD